MTLIEDYLRAFSLLLPKSQREDIAAELRDIILTRVEAREAELGRPLTPSETEAVLREVGHPVVVAAGYRDGPQHLVGPTLYPYWVFSVKAALTIQAAVAIVVFTVRALATGNAGRAFGQALGSAITGSLILVGVATVGAWLIERRAVKIGYLDHWRVRDLKGLEFAAWDWDTLRERMGAVRAAPRRGVAERWPRTSTSGRALGALVMGTVLALWGVGVLHFTVATDAVELRAAGVEPGALASVDWSAFKGLIYWPVLAYCVAIMVQGALLLARPNAVRLQGVLDLAVGAGVLALAGWVWSASPIAQAVGVGSLAEFGLRVRGAFGHAPPYPLAPLVTLAVALTAVAGLCRGVRGLWELVAPIAAARNAGVGTGMAELV